jgi:large subunit ribosomal protein L29
MAILRVDEIRKMSEEKMMKELEDLNSELIRERGIISSGGAPENPGRMREVRRTIARIKTIKKERYGNL